MAHIFTIEQRSKSIKTKKEKVLKEKNYILEYCDLTNYDNGFLYYDAIFQNKSGLYVYLSRRSITEKSYQIMIYFDPEKLEETKFFIKNLEIFLV